MKKIRVADVIVDFLINKKVDTIFGLMGGGAMFLNDALALRSNKIKTIFNHHEQASSMAAVGYSKMKNGIGAAMFTTGCGSTNAVTGVLDAWQDNLPCIFISGQVKRKETSRNIRPKTNLRNFGVQEADIVSIVESITKYSKMINEPNDIYKELEKAYEIATSGCPGPVWLDIPLDVQAAPVAKRKWNIIKDKKTSLFNNKLDTDIKKVMNLLKKAKRPILVVGNGLRLAKVEKEFSNLVKDWKIPVVSSYLAIDIFPNTHKYHIGTLGTKGNRAANFAIQNSDLVIAFGCRMSVPLTGFEYRTFAREAKICIIDINKAEHKKDTIRIDSLINQDLALLVPKLPKINFQSKWKDWLKKSIVWKDSWPVCNEYQRDDSNGINLYHFYEIFNKSNNVNSVVVADAGSAGYASAQSIKVNKNQRYIMPGGQMEMGFTLPCSIGVAFADPKKTVFAITGDGSFQLNIQELQTLSHFKPNIKLIIWNNSGYLSIKSTQNRFFDGRKIGAGPESGLTFPETKDIAKAYKLPFKKVSKASNLTGSLEWLKSFHGPAILEVICPPEQEIIPTASSKTLEDGSMVSTPLEDMYPFLDKEEFLKNMIVEPFNN
ncbi:thiamine pyrophosphate-binding protein [Desulfobacterota bacterium]|nr:thiamine pyrophosphate-binding protein [Thermodesulfobacteriota bacterium]|tara:strand:- start:14133 stop:15941 length:1809 start_codon:yes stop_codon:yes gene_type:complete